MAIIELLPSLVSSLGYINEAKENQGIQHPSCPKVPNQSVSLCLSKSYVCFIFDTQSFKL